MANYRSAYDLVLNISGKDYGFMLYVDENGMRHWNEGLAPLLTPQQRITEFSYEHIPPEIDVPAAFEHWGEGAGFTEFSGTHTHVPGNTTSNAPQGYNYSRGLDLSFHNRVYVSPLRQSDLASTGAEVAAAPTGYWYSPDFGYWLMAGIYLYQYDLSSGSWVLRDTGSGAFLSLAELNGVMYAAISGAAYHYSTNGTTWTTSTLAGSLTNDIVDLFTVRNSSLWAMRSEVLYTTTNGQNGGVNWSAGVSIGSTSEQTSGMVTANAVIWVFKREGIYTYDGTTVSQLWVPKYLVESNGKYPYVHSDGVIYVVYDTYILAVDPFRDSETPLQIVFPAIDVHDSQELIGEISQINGDLQLLYFTVTNDTGHTYLIKLNPGTKVFHSYAYLGEVANAACGVVGPGVQHAENPCVSLGRGTAAFHYILPRASLRPEEDDNYEFDTSATPGFVYGPWMAYGARAFHKFLNRGTVLGDMVTAGQTITLGYEIDASGTVVDVLTAEDPGLVSANISGTVEFNRIRYQIEMNAVGVTQSPVLYAATLHATLNPPRRRKWSPLISLRPNIELYDGSRDSQDVLVLKNALFAAAEQRVTLTDWHGAAYTVRMLDVQEAALMWSQQGGEDRDEQVFQVSFAEIHPQNNSLLPAQYSYDAYGSGKVYS